MSAPTVLVVDDAREIRDLVEQALTRHGYRVIAVRDGHEALERLSSEPVDLLLTDVVMPGKDGIELLVEASHAHPGLPVVVMSGGGLFNPDLYLDNAVGLGAHRTLLKPFRLDQLLATVQELLPEPPHPPDDAGSR